MTGGDYFDDNESLFPEKESFEAFSLQKSFAKPDVPDLPPEPPPSRPSNRLKPENEVLFGPATIPRPRLGSGLSDDDKSDEANEPETVMSEALPSADAEDSTPAPQPMSRPAEPSATRQAINTVEPSTSTARELKATAAAVLQESERQPQSQSSPAIGKSRHRGGPDSTSSAKRLHRTGRASPSLKLDITASGAAAEQHAPVSRQSFADSPILRKHAIFVGDGHTDVLPAVQSTSPVKDGTAASPQTQLPSFRQLTEFAEIATQQRPHSQVPRPRTHSHSFSSATSPSPQMPYYSYPASAHASPTNPHPSNALSPTSTIADTAYYASPPQYQPGAYYNDRRSSAATDNGSQRAPSLLHQPASSSSDSSSGTAGSSADGVSTAHTTPIESGPPQDGVQRPILPPPPGMVVFKCKWPGCTAPPFTTQYLLSQDRPHYCPKSGCPRSEGGLGFKRKNEMIRHGLVHESPGYICPFCSDRENSYSYPRSDNLLRHVRVHHIDKTRDDPELRDVLDQGGKKRRRKTQTPKASA